MCRESIPSKFHPEKCSRKKFVGFWVVSHVQTGEESAQILFSSPLAEAPPQTSTSPALFGVRSMHIAKPHLDNPPSTCNGLLLTHQKQPILHPPPTCASPRASQPHCPLTSPQHGVLEQSRESSCPKSRAAPRAESPQQLKQRFRSQTTLGGPKLISNGRGGASKLAPRCVA